MAVLKPIKSSVCKDKKVWQQICKTAHTSPAPEQVDKLNALQKSFSKVYHSAKARRAERDRKAIEYINANAERLNRESEENLEFQADLLEDAE